MGLCSSSSSSQIMSHQIRRRLNFPYTVMVILSDGKLQEFKRPIKAQKLLSHYPNCFLCCSETMNVNSFPIQITEDDELQVGQLYFLMPVSKSRTLITLRDLCTLAIKASAAINAGSVSAEKKGGASASASAPLVVDEKCTVKFWGRSEGSCRITNGGGAIGVGSSADHVASAK